MPEIVIPDDVYDVLGLPEEERGSALLCELVARCTHGVCCRSGKLGRSRTSRGRSSIGSIAPRGSSSAAVGFEDSTTVRATNDCLRDLLWWYDGTALCLVRRGGGLPRTHPGRGGRVLRRSRRRGLRTCHGGRGDARVRGAQRLVSIGSLLDTLEATDAAAEAVPGFYRLSLACTAESDLLFGLLTAGEAWDRRTDLSPEDDTYPTALAAGVWYAVHCSLAGWDDDGEVAATVQETVEPHLDRLSPTGRALYTLRFTDETAATPFELRKRLDTNDYITALEIDAYERLLSAFGSRSLHSAGLGIRVVRNRRGAIVSGGPRGSRP
jgi:hypothetical protein